ncbi:MAG TPA: type 4a pilus biogenesis protein PilO [Polyangiaceae bacterium]
MAAGDSLGRLPTVAKIGVALALLGLTGVAYYVVFYGTLASEIEAAKARETQLGQELAQARKAEFAYQKDLAELTERQQRQRELNKVLPMASEYPAFLSAIQNVANVSGVQLAAWSPNAEVTEQFYARVPMKLTLVGRYHQVAKFFYGVSQLDRIINLENVTLTKPAVHGEDVVVQAETLATAFRGVQEMGPSESGDKRGQAMQQQPGGH